MNAKVRSYDAGYRAGFTIIALLNKRAANALGTSTPLDFYPNDVDAQAFEDGRCAGLDDIARLYEAGYTDGREDAGVRKEPKLTSLRNASDAYGFGYLDGYLMGRYGHLTSAGD